MIVDSKEKKENLIESGNRLTKILDELVAMTKVGLNTKEYHIRVMEMLDGFGDTASFLNYKPSTNDRPYPSSVCVSINEEIVHGIPTENPKVLKDGDIVKLDCGVTHKGVIVDAARTTVVGKQDEKTTRLLKITEDALKRGTAAAVNGGRVGDIGFAVSSALPKGYSVPYEIGGHGVGDKVHEEPFIPNYGKKGGGALLVEGQVIAIEPMVIDSNDNKITVEEDGYTIVSTNGAFSAHMERTLLITKKGAPIIIAR